MQENYSLMLSNNNIKTTKRRLAIYEVIANTHKPLDVQEIIEVLRSKKIKINKTTVYRILTIFMENGLINQIELSEGKFRYEIANKSHHHHLVCLTCNKIQGVEGCDLRSFENLIKEKMSFAIKNHKLEFFGICSYCQMSYNK